MRLASTRLRPASTSILERALWLVRFPELHYVHTVVAPPHSNMNAVVHVGCIFFTITFDDSRDIPKIRAFKPFVLLAVGAA